MKPHLAHIQNTLIQKQLAVNAADQHTSFRRYRAMVETARQRGFSDADIIAELKNEQARIKKDIRCGDANFMQGVTNAQNACIASIDLIISELKGDK